MLQTFCSDMTDTHVRLKLDNTTAVACINTMASTKPQLMSLTANLWQWALNRKITLSAEHLPGSMNTIADHESRISDNTDGEWMLKRHLFNALCETFGHPEIDFFASRLNKQIECYVSWRPDPGAIAIDAFVQNWSDKYAYIFPPFRVIAPALQRLEREGATVLIIVPMWIRQVWWTTALCLLAAEPIILPPNCLELPQETHARHPLHKLTLTAMLLSGRPCRQLAYRPHYWTVMADRD